MSIISEMREQNIFGRWNSSLRSKNGWSMYFISMIVLRSEQQNLCLQVNVSGIKICQLKSNKKFCIFKCCGRIWRKKEQQQVFGKRGDSGL